MNQLSEYYRMRFFTFEGIFDCCCFIIPLVIMFYQVKKFQKYSVLINSLLVVAHLAGLYAAMIFFSGLMSLISSGLTSQSFSMDSSLNTIGDFFVNYPPKLFVMVIYVSFFNGYKWQSKVILCAMLYALHHCLIEMGACLSGVINVNYPTSQQLVTYIRYVGKGLTIIAAVFLRIFNIDDCRRVPKSAVIEALCFSIVGVAMAIFRSSIMQYFTYLMQTEYYLYNYYPQLYAMMALVCFVIYIFFCYFFMVRNIRVNEENIELNKKVMRMESNSDMIAVNEDNLKLMRQIKHDIKKQYGLMKVMLDKKQYDKLEKYFNEILDDASNPLSQVDTGNSFFDTVLNLEISKAKAKDIDISTKLVVPPELPVSDSDLTGLLANLMDNAIEACEKIKDGQKSISVTAQVVHDYLVLNVSNTIASDKVNSALLLKTDKNDKELHGIGSKIINDIVKKYNGQINRRVENNIFAVDIMLDIGEASAA